ncbi:amino acid permease [Aspergillus eucalypticola CBS 122712]|uniref:Amino acid permease n=1 Tax=Aspergillus eucalypticola (strain CBS 122712 / IBT 29274) TaxID=1448314 RepID=A0A317UN41_ASPEC|nr:amino acid permease [Aspergillus eucalypticola CBS 122712]PWY63121.1 amino acid permease [Aspergillus eucalypticola CBS 122712]
MASYELKNRASSANREVSGSDSGARDDLALARLGKKAVLKRNFGILSIIGLSCTILGTWEGILSTFTIPLENGGSAGAVYSFIFAWTGTACCFVLLSEMASMAPTSGGQYHWCAMLAPYKHMKFLSYITGWLTVIGWQAAFASSSYMAGTEILGAIILGRNSFSSQAYQGTLLMWAVVVVALLVNIIGGKFLPRLETFILMIHILGYFGVLIPMTYMSDHKSTEAVFKDFTNGGNLYTDGISFFVGMTGCVFAFAGGDAAVHMAEEVNHATVVIPRAILLSVAINGTLGFTMLIATLFCMGSVDAALDSPTGYPFMEIFQQATGSVAGALGLSSILVIVGICAALAMLTATSRQFWSFARDRGVPGWRVWSHVSNRTFLPTYSILLTMTICCLLGLINIGSAVALNDVVSMAVSGLYSSYLIVAVLLLWRRCTGAISNHNASDDTVVNVPGAKLMWGPFRVPGIWGILINTYAVIYIVIVIFFSYWPTELPVTVTNMNYSVVGTMGVVILAIIYYVLRARHVYTGPVIEIS